MKTLKAVEKKISEKNKHIGHVSQMFTIYARSNFFLAKTCIIDATVTCYQRRVLSFSWLRDQQNTQRRSRGGGSEGACAPSVYGAKFKNKY